MVTCTRLSTAESEALRTPSSGLALHTRTRRTPSPVYGWDVRCAVGMYGGAYDVRSACTVTVYGQIV